MVMKVGTNQTDRKMIQDYLDEGEDNAVRIARNLKLPAQAVKNYIASTKKPKAKAKPSKKPAPAPVAVEPEADAPEAPEVSAA